jgi:F-type H+-transporting ATPase subunit b
VKAELDAAKAQAAQLIEQANRRAAQLVEEARTRLLKVSVFVNKRKKLLIKTSILLAKNYVNKLLPWQLLAQRKF